MWTRAAHLSLTFLLVFWLGGCSAARPPIPVGEVPQHITLSAEDEEYGQAVFRELAGQYTLDNDDKRISRVRGIVDKLTAAANVDQHPWHVHVFDDATFSNAAATRGNFIFIWTGIFKDLRTDDELAAVLAHELAHVLGGHTAPSPMEETKRIISGVAGQVAGQIVSYQGPYAVFADLAVIAVSGMMEAILLNPEQQEKELEADHIGLFNMADAGYDPQAALDFWDRVKNSSGYSGGPLPALSSHPTSEERLRQINELLPLALERYRVAKGLSTTAPTSAVHSTGTKVAAPLNPSNTRPSSRQPTRNPSSNPSSEWVWDGP